MIIGIPKEIMHDEARVAATPDSVKKYVADGHKATEVKAVKLYIKPEDRAAYYVINDEYAGKVDLF